MSEALHSTEEGRTLALSLRVDEGKEEDRELDAASLGMLLRRGLKRGAAVARPLAGGAGAGNASPVLGSDGDAARIQGLNEVDGDKLGVWDEPRRKFLDIATRAITGIERLVTSETLEQLRPYVLRRWDLESSSSSITAQGEPNLEEEKEPIPTPNLIPSLSIYSSHIGHLCAILNRETLLPVYRHVSSNVASALVERVIMSGGSRRFNHAGGIRFSEDVNQGWLGVVRELTTASNTNAGLFGRRPEAPWKPALDAARLLTLPSSTSGTASSAERAPVKSR